MYSVIYFASSLQIRTFESVLLKQIIAIYYFATGLKENLMNIPNIYFSGNTIAGSRLVKIRQALIEEN